MHGVAVAESYFAVSESDEVEALCGDALALHYMDVCVNNIPGL